MKEINILGKLKNKAEVKIAIGFPNNYYIGMSSLGWQIIYKELNNRNDCICDRFFLIDDKKIKTLDTKRYLNEFGIIGFSVYYELDYINILKILKNSGIPLYSKERERGYPIIIAGGPAVTLNPEPISDFIDVFVIGEGEEVIHEIIDTYKKVGISKNSKNFKSDFLKFLINIEGVYIPSATNQNKIKRRIISDINVLDTSSVVISPDTDFKNMYLIELTRGCTRGCRFCSAGYIYRKPRFRSLESISSLIEEGSKFTDKVGLVGSAITDYPLITDLCNMISKNKLKVSSSSLRIDRLNDTLLNMLLEGGQKTLTVAPEVASKKLKKFIGKEIENELLLKMVEKSALNGIQNIKLYFIIGLPSEIQTDIEEIVSLVREIKKVFLNVMKPKGKAGKIILSINPFIPKPFTPFQWESVVNRKIIEEKFLYIKKQFEKEGGITIKGDTGNFLLQASISTGDKKIGGILFDIVNEKLKQKDIESFLEGLNLQKNRNDFLPWDFIDSGISEEFLIEERRRAYGGELQLPCNPDKKNCKICGVCGKIT